MFERFSGPKEIMAFGSSRSKGINRDMFPGRSLYNAAVSAGSLEDFIGIYQLLHEKNLVPHEVILETSAWILNPKNNTLHPDVHTLDAEYGRGLARMGLPKAQDNHYGRRSRPSWEKIKELFSPAYFQQALLSMLDSARKGRGLGHAIQSEGRPLTDEMVLHPDLSWTSSEENRAFTADEAILAAPFAKGIQDFPEIPEIRKKEFEAFVRQLLADGVKVTFYRPPWPEQMYQRVVLQYRVVAEEERYLLRFAEEQGIETVGSYNSADLGFSVADFSDQEHLRRRVVPLVFDASARAAATASASLRHVPREIGGANDRKKGG